MLKKAQSKLRQAVSSHAALVEEAEFYKELVDGVLPPEPRSTGAGASTCDTVSQRLEQCGLWVVYIRKRYLRPCFYKAQAAKYALTSVVILWSELVMGFKVNLSPIGQILSHNGANFVAVFSALPLIYM